jgi:hypothetical protein
MPHERKMLTRQPPSWGGFTARLFCPNRATTDGFTKFHTSQMMRGFIRYKINKAMPPSNNGNNMHTI